MRGETWLLGAVSSVLRSSVWSNCLSGQEPLAGSNELARLKQVCNAHLHGSPVAHSIIDAQLAWRRAECPVKRLDGGIAVHFRYCFDCAWSAFSSHRTLNPT